MEQKIEFGFPSCLLMGSLLSLSLMIGCTSETRKAGGSVSVNGTLVKNGKVTFYPAGGGRSGSGPIREDGSYVISYKKLGDGLPPGDYIVTIVADELIERKNQKPTEIDPRVGDEADFAPGRATNSVLKHIVPPKYNRQETTPLKLTVSDDDDQDFPFDIKKQ